MFPTSAFPRARALAFGAALLLNTVQAYESQEPGAIYPDERCESPFGIFQQKSDNIISCHEEIRVMKIVVGEPAAGSECLVCEGVDCPACVTIIGPCKDPIAPCTKIPTTSTIVPPPGSGDLTTILILTPTPSVRTLTVGDNPPATESVPQGNAPPVPTFTRPWHGSSTVTVTIPPSGTDPGSVIVSTPAVTPDSWTTLTTPWTGSFTTTVTIPPTGTEPGSVIVNTPTPSMPSWNTLTTPWTGSFTTTVTIPPTGTEPGLVIVSTPTPLPPSWTTFTTPWTGTFTTTLTFPPTGTWPGSVVVQTPPARTSVPAPPETEPPSWTTQTVPWTGTFTTTITIPPSGTFPGSVIISTPFTTTSPIPTTSAPVPIETETEEEPPITEVEPSSTEAETSTTEIQSETETEPVTETETETENEEPTPTPTSPPTFSCDEGGYLIQGTVLYRLDLETGENPSVSDSVGPGGNINALGYNILDNYLYGLVQISGSNYQVIQIDAEGGHVLIDTNIDGFHDTGDIDANGQLWIARAQSTSWAQIDLNPDSATYGEVVDSGPMTPPGARVADWVYLENGGPFLYSIAWSDTARLVRWSMETKEWEFLFDYGDVTDTPPRFGALYAVGDEMWGSDNNSGNIIAFPVLNEGEPARDIIEGPPSSNNDGARCFLAPALDQAAE